MNVIEMKNITKYFGSYAANSNINFTLKKGEIHALLGENGAGKSTLMNILYGLYTPTNGDIYINDEKVKVSSPNVAIEHGIGMVHQHFMLIPQLNVTQNIYLGMKNQKLIFNQSEKAKTVAELNDKFGFNVNPSSFIWQLPVGIQQKVEILKVLIRDVKVLILDEPTAVLAPQEVAELFTSLRKMTDDGYSIILITHKMEEVMDYCDRVTVMKMGELINTCNTVDVNERELARMMVDRDILDELPKKEQNIGKEILSIKDISVYNNEKIFAIKKGNLSVSAGEIIGVAGVDGNGQLELGEALTGLRKIKKGSITFNGKEFHKIIPKEMLDLGLGHIPDDRHTKGLVLPFSIKDNILLSSHRDTRYSKHHFINEKAIIAQSLALKDEFDIRCQNIDQPASALSGGNQQKIILARVFDRNPQFILAIQPTRGLDIGASEFVRKKLIEARDSGKAVLLISTDLDEIMSVSDKIVVMFDGNITEPIPTSNTSKEQLGLLMAGGKEAPNSL